VPLVIGDFMFAPPQKRRLTTSVPRACARPPGHSKEQKDFSAFHRRRSQRSVISNFFTSALQVKETTATAAAAAAPARNLVLAWNRRDPGGIARLFVPNGELIIPGSVIRSRSAIEKRIRDEQSGRLKESLLRNTVERVSFPDTNTALSGEDTCSAA
jgi:uncharacterized protein (TIGR02246 family)